MDTDLDPFTLAALGESGLREFQLWVPEMKNGDPHVFVARLDADEVGASPAAILKCALEDRRIDRAIVHQETELEWLNHTEAEWAVRVERRPDATFVRPGYRLKVRPSDAARFAAFVEWLLVPGPFCERGPLRPETVRTLTADLWTALFGIGPDGDLGAWSFSEVEPTFLNAASQTVTPNGSPAYFDPDGGNYAWMGVGPDRWFLLLVSVYPDVPFEG